MAETKISKAQAGSGIWTSDSLVAGTNISITEIPQPVIDENTLGVWHFENDKTNAVAGSSYSITNSSIDFSSSVYKFGIYGASFSSTGSESSICNFGSQSDFTIDCWVRTLDSSVNASAARIFYDYYNYFYFYIYKGKIITRQGAVGVTTNCTASTWYHLAAERVGSTAYYYIDGVLVDTVTGLTTPKNVDLRITNLNSPGTLYFDELRISNVARYQGNNFTPWDQPYSAGGDAQYAINNTQSIPTGLYTQSNLIAGSNISITEVPQPVIDSNTLGLFHFDEDTSNSISGTGITIASSAYISRNTSIAKFGTAGGRCTASFSNYNRMFDYETTPVSTGDMTLDCWMLTQQDDYYTSKVTIGGSTSYTSSTSSYYILVSVQGTSITIGSSTTSVSTGTWHHVALEKEGNTYRAYLDGQLKYTTTNTTNSKFIGVNLGSGYNGIDEIRLSNVARYQGNNFTPFTSAYTAGGEQKFQINNTQAAADTDLSNVNNTGTSTGAGWAMPSSTYTSLTVGASGTSYTASSTGFVFVNATCSIGGYCCVSSNQLQTISQSFDNTTISNWVPVKKGESFELNYGGATINSFIFIYAEGSKSEAN